MLLIALLMHPEAVWLVLLYKSNKVVLFSQTTLCICLSLESGSEIYAFIFLNSFTSKLGHSEECFKMTINNHTMET